MSKKNFKDSPAAAFLRAGNVRDDTQNNVHNDVSNNAHQMSQINGITDNSQKNNAHNNAQSSTHTSAQKKARINLVIDSQALYERIQIQAEREGKSVTRYMNDLALNDIARSDYLENKKGR